MTGLLASYCILTSVSFSRGYYRCVAQPPMDICARRNYPQPLAVCLKYGIPGAGEALIRAADAGHPAVVKTILQHWTGEDDMVSICTHCINLFFDPLRRKSSLKS